MSAAAIMPITFWESFIPCPILNRAAENNCNFPNTPFNLCGLNLLQICKRSVDKPIAKVIPISGAAKIKIAILKITEELTACQPQAQIAAPANPPMRV